ncbi:MAG: efflux RND transporter periplasmic adaptor subunit [Spirochaetaceae bacterium]
MRKSLWLLFLSTTILLAGCGGRPGGGRPGGDGAESGGERESLAVEAVEVTAQRLVQEIRGSGVVRGEREAIVVSETEGVLEFVDFRLGDFVEEGEALTGVDDSVEQLNYEQARQELQRALIELNAAERRAEAGTVSEAELARVRSAASGARSRVEQTRELLENRTLTAPISGYIASKANSLGPGNYLQRGVEVARIVDLARLEVEISVGEREVRFLEVGSPAEVIIPSCEPRSRPAAVEAIAAGSDLTTGSFPVVVAWENECADVRSGVSATVAIEPTNQRSWPVVPASAVFDDDGDHVFVAEEGRAVRREVTVEERLGNRAAISEGLSSGEIVLVSGLTVLADGEPVDVTVREER